MERRSMLVQPYSTASSSGHPNRTGPHAMLPAGPIRALRVDERSDDNNASWRTNTLPYFFNANR
jgi:hypothetical protein